MLRMSLFSYAVFYLDIISFTNRFGRRFPNCKLGTSLTIFGRNDRELFGINSRAGRLANLMEFLTIKRRRVRFVSLKSLLKRRNCSAITTLNFIPNPPIQPSLMVEEIDQTNKTNRVPFFLLIKYRELNPTKWRRVRPYEKKKCIRILIVFLIKLAVLSFRISFYFSYNSFQVI